MIAHQDLTAPSFGPLISVHPHYIDFSSPGEFEGDTKRAMDMLPSSKNEIMVDLLHLVHICEARGTGIDLMEEWMGLYKLPSPIIQNTNGSTHLILRHCEKLSAWNSIDVINTIYMFASYCYISVNEISNADVRERLNVKEENAAMISRIMKQALDEGLVRIANPNAGAKARKYVPYWA
jgi:predicted HTH transcriptional regulator